jgi:hypothetical protein
MKGEFLSPQIVRIAMVGMKEKIGKNLIVVRDLQKT